MATPDPNGGGKKKKKAMGSPEAWREARALIWHHRRYLALGMVLTILSRLAGLVLPAAPKFVIDRVINGGDTGLLMPLALVVAGATLIQAVGSFALSQIISITAQRAITDMRRRVMQHVTRLPVRYYDGTQTGILISRIMTDAEGIRNLVGTGLVQLVGGAITAVFAVAALLYLNWQLTLWIVGILIAFGAVMGITFTKLRPLFRERGQITAEVTGRLNETLGGIRVVKAYGTEKREERVFTRGAHRLFRNVARSITGISAVTSAATVVIGLVAVVVILVGGRAIIAKQMTVGDLFSYLAFTAVLAAPVMQIASIGTQITEAFAGLDRIREILGMRTEDQEDATRDHLDLIRGDVRLERVWYEYNEGQPVLRDVTVDAPAGTTTALVGSSGSGKSTLVSLVMAFNRPTRGRVLVDGRDLDEVKLADYRAQLGVVLQENFLFDGTVADNIRFARPDATRAEIEEVAELANADEFIRAFSEGYDTIVGERGIKLSGGQRQRIAIARALLADPRILILDEATSSLDSESEYKIQQGLRRLREGRTSFVIAHRLSTIRSADQILVLEKGEIVERGTHAELMALRGRYRELHDRQYALESDRFINPGEDFTPEPEVAAPKVRVAAT
ncbi:ABC transporter ATP-binding protein [Longimicrobium sp.]|uniref:ABC transporter ATP-binding protein n=1 Tax=Longimicrobium sp. TaxID=2029185 RepID=UPI002CCDDEBE|nr:ABC transporter ATP-binding protein [Longimicrobium sp.]HSU15985.1 ABC transporter ATP-binding protein [Longimicrobium sp.]